MRHFRAILALSSLLLLASQAFAQEPMPGKDGKHQRPSFATLDSNSDNHIDFDEFSTQEIRGGDHQTIFDSIDSDGDGKVSEQEFNSHKPPRRR